MRRAPADYAMTSLVQRLARWLCALLPKRERYRPEKHYMRGCPSTAAGGPATEPTRSSAL
jgi:hypothetical protein